MQLNTVDELISDIRQGRMVVLLDDDADSNNEGVVMVAAEHCDAGHVNFMARQARGLVCLTLTEERCRQLDLPPMVDERRGKSPTLPSLSRPTEGIDTGISAADRARTVQAAVAPYASPQDIVQPGHIFPLTAVPGGVLTRAGHTEAASDYARLAGLLPAAVIADILTPEGMVADGPALREFAAKHQLKIGTIADLIHFRMVNERTIRRIREGTIQTEYGEFQLTAYRDQTAGEVHLALSRGDIVPDEPTLVRVHVQSVLRDLVTSQIAGQPSLEYGQMPAGGGRERPRCDRAAGAGRGSGAAAGQYRHGAGGGAPARGCDPRYLYHGGPGLADSEGSRGGKNPPDGCADQVQCDLRL